jgi:hypothetical protein
MDNLGFTPEIIDQIFASDFAQGMYEGVSAMVELTNIGEAAANVPEQIADISDLKEYYARPICGVYFLLRDEQVVYVGQSTSLGVRIASHDKRKDFDRVVYFECHPADLNRLETAFILKLKPEYNRAFPRGFKRTASAASSDVIASPADSSDQQGIVARRRG